MRNQRSIRGGFAALGLALAALGPAQAAGGHHAVDDASILEPGQCEFEGWITRERGQRSLHVGPNCRVGPVEVGLAADHARPSGQGSQTGWSAQVKWAAEVDDGFSLGVSLTPSWAAHAQPRYQGFTLSGLATWQPRETLALHLNLGRDFVHRGADDDRYGVAAEWAAFQAVSVVAERYRESGTHFVRAGMRWSVDERWTVDLSRAYRLQGPSPSSWTIGVSRSFGR